MKNEKGSLTVEASFVFPIFMFAILIFIYFLQLFVVQEKIQKALTETAAYVSKYGYINDYMKEYENEDIVENKESIADSCKLAAKLIDKVLIKNKFLEFADKKFLDSSCISGGCYGISFIYSKFMENENNVDIVAFYTVKFPIPFFYCPRYNIFQRVRIHAFNGRSSNAAEEEETDKLNKEEEYVYITESGKVYHKSKECTHLKLSIKKAEYKMLEQKRNSNGGIYKQCEICGMSPISEIIYITNTGDRYHITLNCKGLKRTIIIIPISEIEGMNCCKRCEGNN